MESVAPSSWMLRWINYRWCSLSPPPPAPMPSGFINLPFLGESSSFQHVCQPFRLFIFADAVQSNCLDSTVTLRNSLIVACFVCSEIVTVYKIVLKTPWPESASELYRSSDRRLLAMLVPTFAVRRCHLVSVKDPHYRIFGFLDRSRICQVAP
jgi:hypothetical protein